MPLRDVGDIEQACIDALLKYLQAPESYDPSRAQLLTYLAVVAKGKAMTIARSNTRRLARDGKYLGEETVLDASGDNSNDLPLDWSAIDATHRSKLVREPGDEVILELIAAGENEPRQVAKALNLSSNSEGEAEAAKRMERMRGRLRRLKTKIGA